MKKLMICLISVLFLISCGKEDMEYAKVRFSYAMQGESMTKTIDSDDVLNLIKSTLPESLAIEVNGLDVNAYTETTTGSEECLPIGTYRITHSEEGELFSTSPVIMVDDTIDVHSYITSYEIEASYDCYALCYDVTAVKEIQYKGEAVSTLSSGDIRLVFVASGEDAIDVTLIPCDNTDGKETLFSICAAEMEGSSRVANGYFYKMTPSLKEDGQGTLELVFKTWEEGTL